MRPLALSLGVLAVGLARAHKYPDCDPDNCYRNLIDERFAELGVSFCFEFLAGTTTAPSAIPTDFVNCEGNVNAVSSACSCITYTATATATSTFTITETPETSTTEVPLETLTSDAAGGARPHDWAAGGTHFYKQPEEPAPTSEQPGEPEPTSEQPGEPAPTIGQPEEPSPTTGQPEEPAPTSEQPEEPSPTSEQPEEPVPTSEQPEEPVPTSEPQRPTSFSSFIPTLTTITSPTTTPSPTGEPFPPIVTAGAGRAIRGVEGIAAAVGLFAFLLQISIRTYENSGAKNKPAGLISKQVDIVLFR
ncbi:hypothetical protein VTH06DRAFT_73 [Thermothelomyces fergusii]